MAHFDDLSPCTYFGRADEHGYGGLDFWGGKRLIAIGWLELDHEYAKGSVSTAFLDRLREMCANAHQPVMFDGGHACHFCLEKSVRKPQPPGNSYSYTLPRGSYGSTNLFVPTEDAVYASPALILHYVSDHEYAPPKEFQAAVLACPPMNSGAYFRRIGFSKSGIQRMADGCRWRLKYLSEVTIIDDCSFQDGEGNIERIPHPFYPEESPGSPRNNVYSPVLGYANIHEYLRAEVTDNRDSLELLNDRREAEEPLYFEDLTEYAFSVDRIDLLDPSVTLPIRRSHKQTALNIGWLSAKHLYREGETSAGFLEKLAALCAHGSVQWTSGGHPCVLCGTEVSIEEAGQAIRLGAGEVQAVHVNGAPFIAPDMIYHYVSEHGYRPPEQFIEAVMDFSPRQTGAGCPASSASRRSRILGFLDRIFSWVSSQAVAKPQLEDLDPDDRKLLEALLREDLLAAPQVVEYAERQRQSPTNLPRMLIRDCVISFNELVSILVGFGMGTPKSRGWNAYSIFYDEFATRPNFLDSFDNLSQMLERVAAEFARKHLVLPVALAENVLSIAVADPLRSEALDELRAQTGCEVKPFLWEASELQNAIEQHYGRLGGEQLGNLLVQRGLVSKDEFRECVRLKQRTGQCLAQILLERDIVSEERLASTLSDHFGVPFMRVGDHDIPKEVLYEIPESLALKYLMLPVSITDNVLTLAMADPFDLEARIDRRITTPCQIKRVVARRSELVTAIAAHYGGRPAVYYSSASHGL